jgi:prophage antirepressor-like protein
MADITILDFEDEMVRTLSIEGEPWFVGKDVCRCLEIGNHRDALGRLDDDERRDCVGIADAIGRKRETIVISEPGVYRLVFTSRSEAAGRFKRWLAHEVLPAIRRTGAYTAEPARGQAPAVEPPVAPLRPEPLLSSLDVEDLYKTAPLLREWRLVWGRATARRLARRLPSLQALVEGEEDILARTAPAPDQTVKEQVEHGIGLFVEEAVARGQGARTSATAVFVAYVEWCGENEIEPASQTRLGRRLAELGWRKERLGGRIIYRDLELLLRDEAWPPERAEKAEVVTAEEQAAEATA